jgi:hypothetical protein
LRQYSPPSDRGSQTINERQRRGRANVIFARGMSDPFK